MHTLWTVRWKYRDGDPLTRSGQGVFATYHAAECSIARIIESSRDVESIIGPTRIDFSGIDPRKQSRSALEAAERAWSRTGGDNA